MPQEITREQSEGIAQVNVAATQLDQMTQQNAGLAPESTTSTGSLEAGTRKLTDAVSAFRSSAVTDSFRSKIL